MWKVMRKILTIGVLAAMFTVSGCYYYGPCMNGYGPVISEGRDIANFTGVSNAGSFDVYVTEADRKG
jgi:ABC-type sulfate transport system permease component